MDYSMAEEEAAAARNAKGARVTTPSAGDDDVVDLISDLDDDVLLRVLALVPDASDAVRMAALSRRWLGLWTRVPALRFNSWPGFSAASAGGVAEDRAALERYAAFVDGVLARRAQSGCAIESLSIACTTGFSILKQTTPAFVPDPQVILFADLTVPETVRAMQQLMPACGHAAHGWIQNAFRHGVKSFNLDLCLPPLPLYLLRELGDVVLLDGLHSRDLGRIETLRLALGGARLRLPAGSVKFASLVHLSLERITIAAGGGAHLLGRLVSSASCPHLRKLCMRNIYLHGVAEEMRIEADVLSELSMDNVLVLWSLKLNLRTPRLRVLDMYKCSYDMLTISAPRLEELAISFLPGKPPRWLEIQGGLLCVRSLKICLCSHRPCRTSDNEAENDNTILLLKHCGSLSCLDVALQRGVPFTDDVDIITSRAPELPHITSLTVNVSWFDRHEFVASVASLLTRFSNLRHLSLHLLPIHPGLDCNMPEGSDLPCDHPDHWNYKDISMAHLLELELTGFTGPDCELWFMKSMLITAKRVRKVAISFNKSCRKHQAKMDAFQRMLFDDEGMWASHRDEHMLTYLR